MSKNAVKLMQEMVAISEEIDVFKRQISSKREELEKLNKSLMAEKDVPAEGDNILIECDGTLWNIELTFDGVPEITKSSAFRVKGDEII